VTRETKLSNGDAVSTDMKKTTATSTEAEELDALYEGVMNCDAVIASGDVDYVADMVFDKERVVRLWRLAAFISSKDGSFYRKIAADAEAAEAMATTIEPLREFAKTLRKVADLADRASARLLVAGAAHEKFIEWMAGETATQSEARHG
jgi:hypothetical protein